ncbi:MNI1 s-adenosylmethionine-dependent methyltransferase of the seven beta-strand family [Fusarium subglutinans]|uniref:protein-histidine N-methyltransferase n=1 Tax=Gibberella subglutinans TaxID=42677 RepID=A0A8H5UZY8_GIBSU|nr:MNI1 s-adenosylmethionine-dependent methyltransferase of the seven beta-strand family [Fusarium subglutinans]KAF5603349.1 MNI1 s-adenosylmethionine-dependent methyltransferase of the seven beta-strand family [Fusarium subglutinans]
MSFSFDFAGDDISDNEQTPSVVKSTTTAAAAATTSAFPVPGKPQLPPTVHQLSDLLAQLPSKIAYSLLDVTLDDGTTIQLSRRELWDVRVQLMAEEEDVAGAQSEGLGSHDVKTGVYEGGFKSWESSVDLVKVLAANNVTSALVQKGLRVMELGCGTALPSLAVFQWAMASTFEKKPLSLIMADYNPSVLQLVTLPNFILSWALNNPHIPALQQAFSIEGEVELGTDVLAAFEQSLKEANVTLSFVSGAWSQEFVDLIYALPSSPVQERSTLLLGAETIYSPFALQAFLETLFLILEKENKTDGNEAAALVGAKRLYFGVGGSLDDFIDKARQKGARVEQLREEVEGVRRGVVQCVLGPT